MLKPLTLSLSLALALCATGVSKAGGLFHNDGCSTCGIASPQAPAPSAQCESPVCGDACGAKRCSLFSGLHGRVNCWGNSLGCLKTDLCARLKPKPKCYTYEWVLKKKRVWGHHGGCDTCGETVVPSSQAAPSGQAGYSSPQYGSGQLAHAAPAPISRDEAPPAPDSLIASLRNSLLARFPSTLLPQRVFPTTPVSIS